MLLLTPTPALPIQWCQDDCSDFRSAVSELGHPLFMSEASTGEKSGDFHHLSVLFEESVHFLAPERGKLMVDATLGGGGHTRALLERGCEVIGLDRDPVALSAASERLQSFGSAFRPRRSNFAHVQEVVTEMAPGGVDGLLMDLGVSSHQLDCAERGFSLRSDGPLDMRMDPSDELTAADIVNGWGEEEMAHVFWSLGEERKSRAVARAIVRRREKKSFERTLDLAGVVAGVVRGGGKTHPATRSFQALRLRVNGELDALAQALEAAPQILRPGGRLVVISFHSLEDRIVKHFLKARSEREIDRPEWPEPRVNPDYCFEVLTRRPVTASGPELKTNPRARSAKLRAAQKLLGDAKDE